MGSEDAIDLPMLEGLLTRHQDSLMVLAAPSHPDVRERVTPALVRKILRTLREGFDYVVVDTAPSFDDQTLTALDETDECVIVATLDVPTLKNVKVALETLEVLDIARGHRHLLLNRADDAVGISTDKVESILGHGDRRPGRRPPSRSRPPPTPAPRSSPRSRSTSPAPRSSSSPRRSSARRWPSRHRRRTGPLTRRGPRAGRFRRKKEVRA